MEIVFNNKTYLFIYSDNSECWMAEDKIKINNFELFIEIYLNDFNNKIIDWSLVPQFLNFIEQKNVFDSLNESSIRLLSLFYKETANIESMGKYRFELEGVFFKGKQLSFFIGNKVFRYSLVFKLYHSDYIECYDPYSNYFVDVDNGLITGIRKE